MWEGGGRRPENGQHPDLVQLDILGQCMHDKSLQLCPTLCDPMDCSLPGPLSMNSTGKNTGVAYHFLLQGTFLTQGSNLGLLRLLHWQADSLPLILGQGVAFFLSLWVCVLSRSVVSDSL